MSETDIYMLKPFALHILVALAESERHGYGLMQAIREQSAGELTVQTASFYRHLGRLIEEARLERKVMLAIHPLSGAWLDASEVQIEIDLSGGRFSPAHTPLDGSSQ